MTLAWIGVLAVLTLLALIMSKRVSPLVALIAVPVLAGFAGGFASKLGGFMLKGIQDIAPVAGMFIFAILYFGMMTDAGLIEPVIRWLLRIGRRAAGTNRRGHRVPDSAGSLGWFGCGHVPSDDSRHASPFRQTVDGPARLSLCLLAGGGCELSSLDGTGAARFRGAAHSCERFVPAAHERSALGLLYVFAVSWFLGKREERRLGWSQPCTSRGLQQRRSNFLAHLV